MLKRWKVVLFAVFFTIVCVKKTPANVRVNSFGICLNGNDSENEIKLNPRKEKPLGVYAVLYNVPAYSSFAISYFPVSTINIEAGIGLLGLYGQFTYHLKGSLKGKKHTFYMGGTIVESGNFNTSMTSFYFPLGIKWIGDKGLGLTFEIPAFKLDPNIPTLIFKIGYQI